MENSDFIPPLTPDNEEETSAVRRPMRHRRADNTTDKYFKLRNILNIIFMLGAVVGVCLYLWKDSTVGTIVILGAVVVKMVECCFRLIRL